MPETIKIRKGLDIPIKGQPQNTTFTPAYSSTYAVKPTDFHGIKPKVAVKTGDRVKAGTTIAYNKDRPEIRFTAPVSGYIETIERGDQRKILEIIIQADATIEYENFNALNPEKATAGQIKHKLLQSGLWLAIRQRPYNIVADPDVHPKAIFISGFDTAPLAPDMDKLTEGGQYEFNTGIQALKQLTSAPVHLSLPNNKPVASTFASTEGIHLHYFKGPHPAGNTGIHIHHLHPITTKNDIIWTLHPQHVMMIGRLFLKGIYDASKTIALTGSEVKHPGYYNIIGGASIEPLISNNIAGNNVRYISGNVLTGKQIHKKGHLGFFDHQVTVIPEGNQSEFLGWLKPGWDRFSASKTFLSCLRQPKTYRLTTNLHGGPRAFVLSGQYEKVLPMDLYPVHLLKSIIIGDIDMMEKLGIHEVVEEDLALCEYVCTSKMEVQALLRQGIQTMIKEQA